MLFASVSPISASPSGEEVVRLQILAFNDFHGQLEQLSNNSGGAQYLAAYINKLESTNPNTIVVSAGDNIGGSPMTSALFHDEPTIEAFNLMGVDYSAVGNHELDEGLVELMRMQYGLCHPKDGCKDGTPYAGAGFSYLGANIVNKATGSTLFPPYKISFVQGIPVGFIGVTLEDAPAIVSASSIKGLKFLDEAGTINRYVKELKERGVETIVVLIHNGGKPYRSADGKLALDKSFTDIVNRTNSEVDVFITGHTHNAYNTVVDRRIVTQAGSKGTLLTDIDLNLNSKTGEVINASAHYLKIDHNVPEDIALSRLVDRYVAIASPLADKVVGSITENIDKSCTTSGESKLGDVIADVYLQATSDAGAVAAFTNQGGIRNNLIFSQISGGEKPGEVTYEEAQSVLPFENNLITMTLTGSQLDALLEKQFGNPEQGSDKILQVSKGFTYAWSKGEKKGNKVDIASIKIDGKKVDPKGRYRITTNSFLADGSEFKTFKKGSGQAVGKTDIEALTTYFSTCSPVAPGPRDRIKVVA
jgi:5'-nucleotidase